MPLKFSTAFLRVLALLSLVCVLPPSVLEAQTITHSTTLLASSTLTATGPAAGSGFVAVPSGAKYSRVRVNAVNNSGTTPTLDVTVKYCYSQDNATCKDLYAFTQCTTGSCWTDGFTVYHTPSGTYPGPYLKVFYTLGGTNPNYTVSSVFEWGT